eukprot:CAMPEP_0185740370 /NCGR_PEP_ID=MMETSP1171-20130828/37612_1 /TAXON_ID=374046 /ORGANISM="Helicotheca tamensis, Strain CCMP826" /LENGTH=494 /DNA_ID=CAMNT_0028412195 /DNA_START=117 /DNA_END=1601 /DNA_ORIENTATION=+
MTSTHPQYVNITGLCPIDDPSFRYKMPLVCGKRRGKKTIIPNLSVVAESIHASRPHPSPEEMMKFLSIDLATHAHFACTTEEGLVSGSYTDNELRSSINKYIEFFILCPVCRCPETTYRTKKRSVFLDCVACGSVEEVDIEHNLCRYILSHHKNEEDEKCCGQVKNSKNQKRKHSGHRRRARKMKGRQRKRAGDNSNIISSESNDDCSSDPAELAAENLKSFLQLNQNASTDEILSILHCNAEQLTSPSSSGCYNVVAAKIQVLLKAAFTPNFLKNEEFKRYSPVISALTHSIPEMERHLIGAMEVFCLSMPKSFPVMLQQLYDNDVLKEDVILQWAEEEGRTAYTDQSVDETSRGNLRQLAQPLIVWLQEAEEETTDEEDFCSCNEDDEDDEVEYRGSNPTDEIFECVSSSSVGAPKLIGSVSWCDSSLEDSDNDYLLRDSSQRKVHFMPTEISGIREIPRISMDDWSSLFYTAHEIQRMHDDYREELHIGNS